MLEFPHWKQTQHGLESLFSKQKPHSSNWANQKGSSVFSGATFVRICNEQIIRENSRLDSKDCGLISCSAQVSLSDFEHFAYCIPCFRLLVRKQNLFFPALQEYYQEKKAIVMWSVRLYSHKEIRPKT